MNYKIIQRVKYKEELKEIYKYIKDELYAPKAAYNLLKRITKETENLSYSARAYYLLRQIKRWQHRKQTTHNKKLYYL